MNPEKQRAVVDGPFIFDTPDASEEPKKFKTKKKWVALDAPVATAQDMVADLVEFGDPELGGGRGKRKRKRPVDLNPKAQSDLENVGYHVEKVEAYHYFRRGFVKRDLFGIADFVAFAPGGFPIYIQVTTLPQVSEHIRTINKTGKIARLLLATAAIIIMGYYKDERGHWKYETTNVTLDQFEARRRK